MPPFSNSSNSCCQPIHGLLPSFHSWYCSGVDKTW